MCPRTFASRLELHLSAMIDPILSAIRSGQRGRGIAICLLYHRGTARPPSSKHSFVLATYARFSLGKLKRFGHPLIHYRIMDNAPIDRLYPAISRIVIRACLVTNEETFKRVKEIET